MLRLLPSTDVSSTTVFDAKIKRIQDLLQKSFVVQKTILNESSVCFQIDVSLERTDVSCLWRICADIDERFDCRCFLTLTRRSAEFTPKLQVIVDTDDRPLRPENENVELDRSIENVLKVLGCDRNHSLFHLPGDQIMIKCALSLDKDGILDLGGTLVVAHMYWGQRCKNVSLFGSAENMDGTQTVYVTLQEDVRYDDESETESETNDENVATVKQCLEMVESPPHVEEIVMREDIVKDNEEEASTSVEKPTSEVESRVISHKASLSRFGRTALFAVLTGIVIPVTHLFLKSKNIID